MNDSIFDIINDAPDDMIGEAVTPAGAHHINGSVQIKSYVVAVQHSMARR